MEGNQTSLHIALMSYRMTRRGKKRAGDGEKIFELFLISLTDYSAYDIYVL